MKFSMNGFRHQLSRDIAELRDLVKDAIKMELHDSEELVDAMNRVITHSNVVNCVYIKDDPDFTDMNEVEIEHLELDDCTS
jgi:hypothetical protein